MSTAVIVVETGRWLRGGASVVEATCAEVRDSSNCVTFAQLQPF